MKYISKSREETQQIAKDFIDSLKRGDTATVVAMTGDLGSGKTSFSQFVGEALGVRDSMPSPTFLIEKIYELKNSNWLHLIHIDAYRLEKNNELLTLGWEEIIKKPENLILIEWSDRVKEIIPKNAYHIVFTHVDENTRQIEISPA